MKQFIEDLAKYISLKLDNNEEFGAKIQPMTAFNENVKLEPPAIYIQQIDDSEAQQFNTLEGEIISYVPVQITIYSQKRKVNNNWITSQEMAYRYAEELKEFFDTATIVGWNRNIKLMRRVGTSPSMPTKNGVSTYFSVLRYDFYVDRNYKKVF